MKPTIPIRDPSSTAIAEDSVLAATRAFREQHGRAPRVLCVGNVANNGYNNGKILARAGWDIDVMCYDYYHIMGCPEWEDADFEGDVGDPFNPNWRRVDLNGFERPSWFVQGPRHMCVRLLLARRENRPWDEAYCSLILRYFQNPIAQRTLYFARRAKRVAIRGVSLARSGYHYGIWRLRHSVSVAKRLAHHTLEWLQNCHVSLHATLQSKTTQAEQVVKQAVQKAAQKPTLTFDSYRSQFLWHYDQWAYKLRTARAHALNFLQLCEASAIRRTQSLGVKVAQRLPAAIAQPAAKLGSVFGRLLKFVRDTVVGTAALVERGALAAIHFPFVSRYRWLLAIPFAFVFPRVTAALVCVALVVLALRYLIHLPVRRRERRQAEEANYVYAQSSPPNEQPSSVPISAPPAPTFESRCNYLLQLFRELFPDREDQLAALDIVGYTSIMPEWNRLMAHYDLVIGYATDGIYPLLAGKRPYVAYEHGTIRSIPFEPTSQGRTCALTYKLADAVVITNCDCDIAAERLQLDNHRFIPHPINEDWLADDSWLKLRNDLRRQLNSDFIIFHPSRQHWEAERHPSWEKGNDFLIRGFARFVHEVCPTAAMVCVAWGKTLQQSKDLLAELGVADRVMWIEPKPTVRMTRYIRACDAVADQFYLGAFGGVMPKAMVYGRPTLIYLNEERHRWCFPEMPPICNTRTPDEVFESLKRLRVEPHYMEQMVADGLEWYAKYHSSQLVAQRFDDILGDVLSLTKADAAPHSGDQRRCA